MSRQKLGGRDPPPYKYATRKALDHHTDRLARKLTEQKEDLRQIRNSLKHIIRFLREGPHAIAYEHFIARLEQEEKK